MVFFFLPKSCVDVIKACVRVLKENVFVTSVTMLGASPKLENQEGTESHRERGERHGFLSL